MRTITPRPGTRTTPWVRPETPDQPRPRRPKNASGLWEASTTGPPIRRAYERGPEGRGRAGVPVVHAGEALRGGGRARRARRRCAALERRTPTALRAGHRTLRVADRGSPARRTSPAFRRAGRRASPDAAEGISCRQFVVTKSPPSTTQQPLEPPEPLERRRSAATEKRPGVVVGSRAGTGPVEAWSEAGQRQLGPRRPMGRHDPVVERGDSRNARKHLALTNRGWSRSLGALEPTQTDRTAAVESLRAGCGPSAARAGSAPVAGQMSERFGRIGGPGGRESHRRNNERPVSCRPGAPASCRLAESQRKPPDLPNCYKVAGRRRAGPIPASVMLPRPRSVRPPSRRRPAIRFPPRAAPPPATKLRPKRDRSSPDSARLSDGAVALSTDVGASVISRTGEVSASGRHVSPRRKRRTKRQRYLRNRHRGRTCPINPTRVGVLYRTGKLLCDV